MRKQDIEIVISPTGEVTYEVKGVKGSDCMAETKFLDDALGGEVLETGKTAECYEQSEGYGSQWISGSGGSKEGSDD